MASGHVNRIYRPNTWLHRPATRREDSPCQLGAVHTWHVSTVFEGPSFGRCWGQTGHRDRAKMERMTQLRHWLCTAPVLSVSEDTVLAPPSLGADISLTRDVQLALMWSSFTRRAYLL